MSRKSAWERFWEKVEITSGCWLWVASTDDWGYGVFWTGERREKAHRWMWMQTHGRSIPDGLIIRHTCDTPPCVRPSCLLLGTHLDNAADCRERGRLNSREGSLNPRARLTPEQVHEIRLRYREPSDKVALAQEYGVTRENIHHIITGKTWTNLPVPTG